MQIQLAQIWICRYKSGHGYGLKGITGKEFQILRSKKKIFIFEGVLRFVIMVKLQYTLLYA